MSRSYLFRRPNEEDDDLLGNDVVRAKPIDERHAKRLGETFRSKDFVRGSDKSQAQFYGTQTVVDAGDGDAVGRTLSHDERNKLQAKILKAELKGNMVNAIYILYYPNINISTQF